MRLTPEQIAAMPAGREMKYRRQSPLYDAVQWNPSARLESFPEWLWRYVTEHPDDFDRRNGSLWLRTSLGRMFVFPGDWIIRDDKGGLIKESQATFAVTFEPISDERAAVPVALLAVTQHKAGE